MPSEPHQRCSQAVFEALLKAIIDANPIIDCYFGLKFDDLEEDHECVQSRLIDSTNGQVHTVKSKYVIACDGAGSRVRKVTKLNLTGGPV
jgi:2-polyprenyl-6-methoxyphenol hydroxylase-like FAD-dependent oxidoreductase